MKLQPIDLWMNNHRENAIYNVAHSTSRPLTLNELSKILPDKQTPQQLIDFDQPQDYGFLRGSPELRQTLADMYTRDEAVPMELEDFLITSGGITANYVVMYALIGMNDHVICQYPAYQPFLAVPRSFGAEVEYWHCRPEDNWVPRIEELKALIRPNTKVIIVNNPHNPTGSTLSKSLLGDIVTIAKANDIHILCDEVHRPMFLSIDKSNPEYPPTMLSMPYRNITVTSSLSKSYALAGIRVGWIACQDPEYIEKYLAGRYYTSIATSLLDQQVAKFALSPDVVHVLLAQNIELAKTNLEHVERFVKRHPGFCSWVKPVSGTTAFIRFTKNGAPINTIQFCESLQKATGVVLMPGIVGFGPDFEGYIRFGFAAESAEVLGKAMELMTSFINDNFASIATA